MGKRIINERSGSSNSGSYDAPIRNKKQKWKKNVLEPFTEPIDNELDDASFEMAKNRVFEWVEITDDVISEDLAVWFGKKKKKKGSSQPKGPWVNICRKKKGGGHPPCGREDADKKGYPVCRAAGVAGKMSQSEKDSACRRKREKEKKDTQTGKGQKPTRINIKNRKKKKSVKEELINRLTENILRKLS